MSLIIPISKLQENPFEVSRTCHSKHEPIFVTKDGYGDMVILSFDDYEDLKIKAEQKNALSEIVRNKNDNPGDRRVAPSSNQTVLEALNKAQEKEDDPNFEKISIEDVIKVLKAEVDKNQPRDKKF